MQKPIFQTTILGSSGAMPTSSKHTSTQLLKYDNKLFLLDCSEGTQMQLKRMKAPIMKINNIFISHLHGDHYLGLPGLLFTLHLLGREKELNLYSPPGLSEIIKMQFDICKMKLAYKINYHDLEKGGETIFEDSSLKIETIEMLHSIPSFGFLFTEKQGVKNIKKEYVTKYDMPFNKIIDIKNGSDYITSQGQILPNEKITIPPPSPRIYAFCSDTVYTEYFIDQIKGANMLYHEATFRKEFSDIARQKFHATTTEAATIALKANVKKLLIGHYSARYNDKELGSYLEEAKTIFSNTCLAEETKTYKIN